MIERADSTWGARRERLVTWHDPAALAAAGSTLTGFDLLQAIIEGRLPPPPIASVFGAELVSAGEGVAVFRCSPDESTYNPMGIVHGGFLCTLLDTAAGCAVIEIRGHALRVGGRVAFAEAHAHAGDCELVGHATTSIALIGPPH